MPLLEVIDATFAYGGGDPVFSGISFQLGKGEVLCLLGPNGCGKTTLLDCILGINRLKSGRILLNDRDAASFAPGQIARHIAYVPQVHTHTFPYRVIDVVTMGRAVYIGRFSSPSRSDVRIAEEMLEAVGLTHLRNRPYTQLSGGEVRLVMIARALAQKTPVIVMDEPTAHLDFKHEMMVLEKIAELVRSRGLSILMATHFPNHAFYFENNNVPTRAALMYNRSIQEVGPPSQVITENNIRSVYCVNTRMIDCRIDSKHWLKQLVPVNTLKCSRA